MIQKRPLIKPILSLGLFVLLACTSVNVFAQAKAKTDTTKVTKKDSGDIKPYNKVITDEAKSDTGLFTIHRVDSKFYFEIPDSVLGRDMIIVSRRAAMSSSDLDNMVAGERGSNPLMVRWEKSPDGKHILLKKVTTRNELRFTGTDSSFEHAVELQTLDPILISFPIKALGPDSGSYVIGMEKLFLEDIKELTPFKTSDIFVILGFRKAKKYAYKKDRSYIKKTQSFDRNIEVVSMMTYTQGDETNIYSILMHRSMILLPKHLMRPRLADERMGNFSINFSEYNENTPVKRDYFVKRWRLEVPKEEMNKFKAGELVEPTKKIIFYIDNSTPEKWRKYIKQGVENWLPAFEKAGFKKAVQVKDIPDDSTFSAEDVRNSVIRYAASPIANAKGPSVVDPRTGEILESDVIIYHNVLKLLRDWRFSQTAANDPDVRTTQIPDSIMGNALRFVVTHEVGHALGLRHNMGASAAFPVDSLRSATFTQKYGTTPSIMDYARFNYVAQPEDKGVKLTPPSLGVYDKYAIQWTYRPIPGAKNAHDEVDTLNSWINRHTGDPRYYFGEGDLAGQDPTSQRESLGDDIVKASEYGVKNIKYTIRHLDKWLGEDGKSYDDMENLYAATLSQYNRYLWHVGTLIGGVYLRRPRQGQAQESYRYVEKKKQHEAVQFLLKQYREIPGWLVNEDLKSKLNIVSHIGVIRKIITPSSYIERLYYHSIRGNLINDGNLMFLLDNQVSNPGKAYTVEDIFQDIREDVFRETKKGEALSYYRRLFQNVYVDWLLSKSHFDGTMAPLQVFNNRDNLFEHTTPFCSVDYLPQLQKLQGNYEVYSKIAAAYAEQHDLYFQLLDLQRDDKKAMIESKILAETKKVKDLVEKGRRKIKDDGLRAHYDYLLRRINIVLKAGK